MNKIFILLLIMLAVLLKSQVGINTILPHQSSALDVQSGVAPKGFLAPRMSSTERIAISAPAESLLVFDTTEKAFFFYNTASSSWIKLATDIGSTRNNYRLIKSASDLSAELTAGGGNSYLLTSNTYYEINGTVTLSNSININNAYVSGLDANEDILSFPGGVVFRGNTGGSIRNLTITGGKAFEITGPGVSSSSSLLIQNTIVQNTTIGVGSITGLGLYFGNIVNFINNANGIIYSNIGNLLLNSQAWLDSNNGTFETFSGTFGSIQKASGFSTVNNADVALDVSNANLVVGTGVIEGTVFSGTSTTQPGYIKGYTSGSYPGFNFSNAWTIDAPGIPRESDSEATGDINLSAEVGVGQSTTFVGTGTPSRMKVNGTTTSNNLFRFSTDNLNNRITYRGNKTRYFQVAASLSYQGNNDLTVIVYIARNGTVINQTKVYGRGTTGFLVTSGIIALPVVGTIQLKKDEYIEIWAERYAGSGDMQTVSLNLTAR
ncbi:hypothetical protein PGH12_07000 [Chryseobacterium wangxinyae]|uniref:hypothetical protein n=1 Tax=Chryseobacterium sp. CY350 TaxID=2997336 RepID=UPI00226E130B|nr:hypothetical protein [Chryseobacterium sp. CY350]MCY0976899.1 hypothetical protein [Chryseobacterium sp. CY350]WBZ96898.1 hypothetical protein PGH12_07000 [Chryseobacterium sp. CY350]